MEPYWINTKEFSGVACPIFMYQFVRQCCACCRIALLDGFGRMGSLLVLRRGGSGSSTVGESSSCVTHLRAYRRRLALGETKCITFI
jgi:hypothetical protein